MNQVDRFWTARAHLPDGYVQVLSDMTFRTKREAQQFVRCALQPQRGSRRVFTKHTIEWHECSTCGERHIVNETAVDR